MFLAWFESQGLQSYLGLKELQNSRKRPFTVNDLQGLNKFSLHKKAKSSQKIRLNQNLN